MSDIMLEEMIVKLGAFKKGDFTLASGRKSDYYIDLRLAITEPEFLRAVVKLMLPFAETADKIAGVELSAVPLAAALSLECGKPYIMVRKKVKEHGTGQQIEGRLESGDRVLFVEDTVTTAGTLVNAIESVREVGGIVETAVVIVDRKEGARENLASIGVEMHSLVDIDRLKSLA